MSNSNIKIIECVPNFSEGQSQEIIDKISEAIRNTKPRNSGELLSLLNVDPGKSTNRTVYTFVGTPDILIEAAFNAAKTAVGLIDMTKHKGEHPRLGAMDVCPFVPVSNSTMEDCAECARKLGEKLGNELKIPIYLYGEAHFKDKWTKFNEKEYRKTVPQIRSGEYEGLAEKITKEEWMPDFGPNKFIPSWGASMVGARKFLLAYNINILSTKEQAHRIALNLREAGRGPNQPGKFKAVQGIGWWLEEENIAQMSFNLTDTDKSSLHLVYEECKKEAAELNLSIIGSELVGLVPLYAMLEAAEFYIKKENLMILDVEQKVKLAIDRLGLNSLYFFNPKERIIEWKIENESKNENKTLLECTVKEFVHKVRERSAAPGGGSVAALVGSLGLSLGSMVGLLTYGKRQWEHLDNEMREIIPPLYSTVDEVLPLIDEDTRAFDLYIDAMRETKSNDSEKSQKALLNAINVPMKLAKLLNSKWEFLERLCKLGNPNCKSDLQVGIRSIETGIYGARYNVLINCESITDSNLRSSLVQEINEIHSNCGEISKKILNSLEN